FDNTDGHDEEIYAMNADGTGVRQLTDNLVDDFSPAWSPDGSRIAYVRKVDEKTDIYDEKTEIYGMNADGSGQTPVTQTATGITRFPVEIHRVQDGALVSRFKPDGEVVAIALAPRCIAVLVKQGRALRIELFDPSSGARRGSVRVPRNAAS